MMDFTIEFKRLEDEDFESFFKRIEQLTEVYGASLTLGIIETDKKDGE